MDKVKKFEDLNDVLTPEEVAEYLRFSKGSVYALLHDGAIKHMKIGKSYRITKQNVADFIATFNQA